MSLEDKLTDEKKLYLDSGGRDGKDLRLEETGIMEGIPNKSMVFVGGRQRCWDAEGVHNFASSR